MDDSSKIPGRSQEIKRREFLQRLSIGTACASAGYHLFGQDESSSSQVDDELNLARGEYSGPNVIIIRFGGGVRRRETVDPQHTYSPYTLKKLAPRGTLFPKMKIDSFQDVNTSHGEGTLNILTGKYDKYKDTEEAFLQERFEANVPTLFEYLRKTYAIPESQTLIINGEDRTQEEFYSFSNHHLFGVNYQSEVLSLYRFKTFLLRRQIESGLWDGPQLEEKQKKLKELESKDYRAGGERNQSPEILSFWEAWREHYGESGFVNPRGDRLLTELSLWSLRRLRPKLMMVNFNDPDYVHWGVKSHYTQGIAIIDEGIERIVKWVDSDEEYRDNTIFVVVPDCGRDSNPFLETPYQHHFNSPSAHEIFGLWVGPGIQVGQVVDKEVDQISVAATIGKLMNAKTEFTEGPVLESVFA